MIVLHYRLAIIAAAVILLEIAGTGVSRVMVTAASAQSFGVTTTTKNGVTTERHKDANGKLIKVVTISKDQDFTLTRTRDSQGNTIEIKRFSETPDPNDSTIIKRVGKLKKYPPGGGMPYETVEFEEQNIIINPRYERAPRVRKTTTKTYTKTKPRKLLKKVVEVGRLVRVIEEENWRPIFEGKRITTTPDGKTVEILDPETQQWKTVPPNESDTDVPEETSDSSGQPVQECGEAKEEITTALSEAEQDLWDIMEAEGQMDVSKADAIGALRALIKALENFEDDCESSARSVTDITSPVRNQSAAPANECKGSGLLGGVECVEERMGD